MEKVIEIKNLTKSYGNLIALDNFNLDVYQGEILGLLGPNGSGKSTCINTILSLLKYDAGKIMIFNQEMKPSAYQIKRKIGVVFQDVAVFEELSVKENIDYFCGLYIKEKKIRAKYVQDAIDLVSLNEFVKFKPKQLSGGLLRRLNIACGIAHKPELIFLDEPTVAVDPQSRNNILDGIKKLRDQGATIVYTTHYMEEVELLCDRVIILDHGKIIAQGTNEQLKQLANMQEKITVEINNLDAAHLEKIAEFENVDHVNYQDHHLVVTYHQGQHNFIELMDYLAKEQLRYNKIYCQSPTLNDVFLQLTGKELRD